MKTKLNLLAAGVFLAAVNTGFGQSTIQFSTNQGYVAEWAGDHYEPPRNLGSAVNSAQHELGPTPAPDESYLLFASNRPPLWGTTVWLWVSFRQQQDGGSR